MAEADDLELRELMADDYARLADLFSACFGMAVGPDYFDWKYRQNPAGEAIAFVADAGDRLAAFYGIIPEPWHVGTAERTIFQSMDTMTHPEFQRRGLFVRLAERTYAEARRRCGSCDLVGIPGPTSLPGFTRKLGWTVVHQFELLTAPCALVRAWPHRRDRDVVVETIDGPDDALRTLLSTAEKPAGLAWPRLDGSFFEWRVFGLSPKRFRVALALRRGQPIGACVYALTSARTTMISYVVGLPDEPARNWFSPLLRTAARHGLILYTWSPQQATRREMYKSMGFTSQPLVPRSLRQPVPLITKSDNGEVNGIAWAEAASFDLQPLMQD